MKKAADQDNASQFAEHFEVKIPRPSTLKVDNNNILCDKAVEESRL